MINEYQVRHIVLRKHDNCQDRIVYKDNDAQREYKFVVHLKYND